MRVVQVIMVMALFSASCDLFLFVNLGGATLRLCQFALLLVMVAASARVLQFHTLLWPRGGTALLLWTALQGILALRAVNPVSSLEFFALMLLPIFGVFALLQLYGRSSHLAALLRIYLWSFVFMAFFGLFQFAAPALHLGSPFIAQWIVHGVIPRINGFSYEPSYYATYMIMGWITLIDLRVSKAVLVSGRAWFWYTWLISFALFLSTSKTGWIFMLVEGAARLLPGIGRALHHQLLHLSRGELRIALPRPRTVAAFTAAVGVVALTFSFLLSTVSRYVDPNILLAGSGLNNSASHSVDKRTEDFLYTVRVIREHPLIGVSLGGVAGRVAQLSGAPFEGAEAVKLHWGFPVPVEVFAASGLFGFIPFVWFFLAISLGEVPLIRRNRDDERSRWLRALIRGLIFEWLCLAADQNLVRMYFWFHISILVAVGWSLRNAPLTLARTGSSAPLA